MRISPLLIGVTMVLCTACGQMIPPVNFRQPESHTGEVMSDMADAPNEKTPVTTDSLEVETETVKVEMHVLSGAVIMGDLLASRTLKIFDDYGCFYCREFGSSDLLWLIKTFVEAKSLKIERVFVPQSPAGVLMAKVALCGAKQDRFEDIDRALHSSPITTDAQVTALAKALKMNVKSLQTCIASNNVTTALQIASDDAKKANVTRLPAFELGTEHWIGIEAREDLRRRIEKAL